MENWKQRIVLKPMEIRKGFEVAVVKCPKAFVTEIRMVFPGQDLDGVLAVLTCQKSKLDLCELGEDIAKEKDELLESFYDEAKRVSGALTKLDHWCDFIDPCSGLPVSIYTLLNLCVSFFFVRTFILVEQALRKHTNRGYSEVDGFNVLLHFKTHSAGMCKVASHPRWGTNFYPATMFTTAPYDVLEKILLDKSEEE